MQGIFANTLLVLRLLRHTYYKNFVLTYWVVHYLGRVALACAECSKVSGVICLHLLVAVLPWLVIEAFPD